VAKKDETKRAPSLVAALYESLEQAEEALAELRRVAGEGSVSLRDAAIVVRGADGKIQLHQTKELGPGEGIVAGGAVGIVVGILVGGPVAGALIGMAAGGGFGAHDTGISDDRLRRLGDDLTGEQAALCALLDRADWPLLRERMAPYLGDVVVSELSDEAVAALAAAGSDAAP
jgi:uncharacterized membrane protein